jgi:hypothetical protein
MSKHPFNGYGASYLPEKGIFNLKIFSPLMAESRKIATPKMTSCLTIVDDESIKSGLPSADSASFSHKVLSESFVLKIQKSLS